MATTMPVRRQSNVSSFSDNSVIMTEEKTAPDGRRILEIEVEPMTRELDLTYLPNVESDTWEVRIDSSRAAHSTTGHE
jgi:hypothetical protein